MNTGILIIAHAPLANALRDCVLHVYPEASEAVWALDVPPHESPELTIQAAKQLLKRMGTSTTLVLTDLFGATPCNVAQKIVDGVHSKLITGVNLPMLLRAVNYRHEPLEMLTARAMNGGTQCIMQVTVTAPLNQNRIHHDKDHHKYQQ